jgi:PhzF family phenazine biosynthesis protein
LHAELFPGETSISLEFVASERVIPVTSRHEGTSFFAEMDQGAAEVKTPINVEESFPLLEALNLTTSDQAPDLPLQVISTGLPYLIVPVHSNLEKARIVTPGFEDLLAKAGARFVYVFDVDRREGRTWDNDGRVEDIATGSAAGPAAVYLVTHKLAQCGESLVLKQGRFLNRPSELQVRVSKNQELSVRVGGYVCLVGKGVLTLPDFSIRN